MQIRPECPADFPSTRSVNCAAFGSADEADLVDALRDGGHAVLSLVAEQDGVLIGHLLLSRLSIATARGEIGALALAPMAVTPERQREGIGSRLVAAAISLARDAGHRIIIVLGHPDFYPRFGFSAELARPLEAPFSGDAWMALELVSGALEGVSGQVVYPAPFGAGNA